MAIAAVKLGWFDRWWEGNLVLTGATVTFSSEQTDFEADRTRDPQAGKTWRADTDSGEWLSGDLGASYKLGMFACISHNLSVDATIRFRLSTDSGFSTTELDTTVNAWPDVYTSDQLTDGQLSEFFNANGQPLAGTLTLLKTPVTFVTFDEVDAQYARMDFTDPSNADGYIEVGSVFTGRVQTLDPNILYGWELWFDEIARLPEAQNGQIWSANVFRRMHFSANTHQSQADTLDFWHWIMHLRGLRQPMFLLVRNDIGALSYWSGFWAVFSDMPQPSNVALQRYAKTIEFEEVL
jgi:hypothetical protein